MSLLGRAIRTHRRRDRSLEDFISRIQVLTGQFDSLGETDVFAECMNIIRAFPVFERARENTAIACALMLDVIVRIATCKHSPPHLPLICSAARLCGQLDLTGMLTALANCRAAKASAAGEPARTLADPRVEKALTVIRTNYRQATLTLRAVADEVHLSPWHLARLLVLHSGASFKAHLQEARRRRAADLLEQSFLSIKEIADASGYSQVQTFERTFKKRLGVPPSRWRQLYATRQQETTDNSTD